MSKYQRIGTIIHGALGDCYEQLCAIKKIRESNPNNRWIGFFAVKERLIAMQHFQLDMVDEVYLTDKILTVDVDYFYQFQINDVELKRDVIDPLPKKIKAKFDFNDNNKPWHIIRLHDFLQSGLELSLSELGKQYLSTCLVNNHIDPEIFNKKITVGYLWRYRNPGGAVKSIFQCSKEWILKSKSELFRRLIDEYNVHILICGMKKTRENLQSIPREVKNTCGFVEGEYLAKYTDDVLNIPDESCTYLRGLGYAAEMEIMSKCALLLMMPSGFSEALWMKKKVPVILVDPPLHYMLKLWWNRMPLFDNYNPIYAYYNTFVKHSETNVVKFLNKQKLLVKKLIE